MGMKKSKVHDRASMMGLGRRDADRLVSAQRERNLPVGAWFKNYEVANEVQKGQILSILRESDPVE